MSKLLGVIAEDQSDYEVVVELFAKYADQSKFSTRKFIGNGCGKLKNKCGSWTKNLVDAGCDHVFVFHDLDRNDEAALRASLEKKVPTSAFPNCLIVIPIEELEAWLLSDPAAIKTVFSLKKAPKRISDCEAIASPKEALERDVWKLGRKRYLNTVHNRKIAKFATLENFRRCRSFLPFDDYVSRHVFKLRAGSVNAQSKNVRRKK